MTLAQYYTAAHVSDQLIAQLDAKEASTVLDIGCGESSLLLAAGKRWRDAELIGFDIDPRNTYEPSQSMRLHKGDGLDPDLSARIIDTYGEIDIAVSNPPYLYVDNDRSSKEILRAVGFDQFLSRTITKIPAELIFLAQNLRVLRPEAELGIILPAGLICGEKWKPFREYIGEEYHLKSCIQLPSHAFKNTEANTFALCFKKEKPSSQSILLKHLDESDSIEIGHRSAISRMDYGFYSGFSASEKKLSDFPIDKFFRGNRTNKFLKSQSAEYIHTTDFDDDLTVLHCEDNHISDGTRYAKAGDILIARVGSRCVGRIAYVANGKVPISECVIVLRSAYGDQLWALMKVIDFQSVVRNKAIGVGAKYITLDILKGIFNAKSVYCP